MSNVERAIIQQNSKIRNIETLNTQQNIRLNNLEKDTKELNIKIANIEKLNLQQNSQVTNIDIEKTVNDQNNKINNIENNNSQQDLKIINLENKITNIETNYSNQNTKLLNLESSINNLPVDSNISLDIFTKLQKSCSQICFVLNNSYYVGSGWYYYDNEEDLSKGFFITAAHCVMQIVDNIYYKISSAFIQNRINNCWINVDTKNIYIDGVADIALIKTNIDFTNNSGCCLKLAVKLPSPGDICYVVGNPGGLDEDSISMGCVRDPNYTEPEGVQITNSIYVTCPGVGGNSGGPIVNKFGDVIGIFTFGISNQENLGGGSNVETIRKSLEILKTSKNNKQKRYLGIDWSIPSPFLIQRYYNSNQAFKTCVYIHNVNSFSPFIGVLGSGDLLLDATLPNSDKIEFGNCDSQKTPGVLIYNYETINIQISYIKKNQRIIRTANISLNKTYADVPDILDGPLQTGLISRKSDKLKIILDKIKIESL